MFPITNILDATNESNILSQDLLTSIELYQLHLNICINFNWVGAFRNGIGVSLHWIPMLWKHPEIVIKIIKSGSVSSYGWHKQVDFEQLPSVAFCAQKSPGASTTWSFYASYITSNVMVLNRKMSQTFKIKVNKIHTFLLMNLFLINQFIFIFLIF